MSKKIGRINIKGAKSGSPVNLYGGSKIGASSKKVAITMRNDIARRENLKRSAIIIKKKKKGYGLYWR